MKKKVLIAAGIMTAITGFSQTQVNLKLNHRFNDDMFAYDQVYETEDGKAVKFSRVQYYLSGMSLTHDGGQTLDISDTYVLGSGNVTDYDLGQHSVTDLEGIQFDLGVDNTNNHNGSSNWSSSHPLSPQSPAMDWGWPAGYFFFVIDGFVDSDDDGTPDTEFQFRGLGDQLLRNVPELSVSETGSTVNVNLYVNIADWVKGLDLVSAGYQHNASQFNIDISDNTNDETVFTTQGPLGVEELKGNKENSLFVDYQLPYAPTIYYSINTNEKLTLTIVDMQGRVVLTQNSLAKDGNFFINKELNSGLYVATFSNNKVKETVKFTVSK